MRSPKGLLATGVYVCSMDGLDARTKTTGREGGREGAFLSSPSLSYTVTLSVLGIGGLEGREGRLAMTVLPLLRMAGNALVVPSATSRMTCRGGSGDIRIMLMPICSRLRISRWLRRILRPRPTSSAISMWERERVRIIDEAWVVLTMMWLAVV